MVDQWETEGGSTLNEYAQQLADHKRRLDGGFGTPCGKQIQAGYYHPQLGCTEIVGHDRVWDGDEEEPEYWDHYNVTWDTYWNEAW